MLKEEKINLQYMWQSPYKLYRFTVEKRNQATSEVDLCTAACTSPASKNSGGIKP